MNNITLQISNILSIKEWQVKNTLELLIDQSATVPFISRYRKEATGELDEVAIENIRLLHLKLTELAKRREFIVTTITQQGNMTDALMSSIDNVTAIEQLEDIYLPFKPKRRTRATIAREAGLEPLSKTILFRDDKSIESQASSYINNEVKDVQHAIIGAMDIVAELVSENSTIRSIVRENFNREATIEAKGVKGKMNDQSKFANYYDHNESLRRISTNRFLALARAEREGELKVKISIDTENISDRLKHYYNKNGCQNKYKDLAIEDSYKRLIYPSIETEIRAAQKQKADQSAIDIFSSNLKQLLLASPLGEKRILAIDPGFRSGCKIVCIDANGNLLHNENIYPHEPQKDWSMAQKKLSTMVESYKIDAIAIGDGTASRETEKLVKSVHFDREIKLFIVSEDGASIYSASSVAREEFSDFDVTVRGAISIGRRLQDPLAELVKIEPKSLGVGEYQHDVDQTKLKAALGFVVESCVNKVGVNLNTASYHILTYISGIGATLAKNITKYRTDNGDFKSRKELLKVPRLGQKVYEQAAGFLRIPNSIEPLDNSAVHPESYALVKTIAKDLGVSTGELIGNDKLVSSIDLNKYIGSSIGEITLKDIVKELAKPSLDPRSEIKAFEFASDVNTIKDLKVGRQLNGIVSNITSFGAFVNIGIKQDGLVHISQMAREFITSPTQVISLHQYVVVEIMEVDELRGRISLTMLID